MKHKYVVLLLTLCYSSTLLQSAEGEEQEEQEQKQEELSFQSLASTPSSSTHPLKEYEFKRTASQQSYQRNEKSDKPKAVQTTKTTPQPKGLWERGKAWLGFTSQPPQPLETPDKEDEPNFPSPIETEEPAVEPTQSYLENLKEKAKGLKDKATEHLNRLRGITPKELPISVEPQTTVLRDGDIELDDNTLKGYRELHAQLKKLDSFILSRTITPLIEKYFPVTKYRALIEDIINNKRIPADIDARIESLVTQLHTTAQPEAGDVQQTEEEQQAADRENKTTMKAVIGSHLLKYVESQSYFVKKLNLAELPGRTRQAQQDIQKVLTILTDTKNPEEILLRIHEAGLESFKKVMINDQSLEGHVESLLKKIDSARKQGIAAGDTVLQITNLYKTYLHIILALGVANLICCVVSVVSDVDSDNYKLSKRILEYLAVIDAISLTIGIGIKAVIADKFHGAFEKSIDALRQNDATMTAKRQPQEPKSSPSEEPFSNKTGQYFAP